MGTPPRAESESVCPVRLSVVRMRNGNTDEPNPNPMCVFLCVHAMQNMDATRESLFVAFTSFPPHAVNAVHVVFSVYPYATEYVTNGNVSSVSRLPGVDDLQTLRGDLAWRAGDLVVVLVVVQSLFRLFAAHGSRKLGVYVY